MASLALRSIARVLRRPFSEFAGKTQPTKHSSSAGHGQHIQQDCQPDRTRTSITTKLDEQYRLLRKTRENVQFLLKQADEEIAWDQLQKRVILPSVAAVGLAFYAHKMLFGESRQEMPVETKPLN